MGNFVSTFRDAHHQLAHSCLSLLLDPVSSLKFNICNLETSYLANKDVADLKSRVDKHISSALLYACRFWDDHLEHIDFETDLYRKLETFFNGQTSPWLRPLA